MSEGETFVTVRVTARTRCIGSSDYINLSFTREEWEDMDAQEREEECKEAMFSMIEWTWDEMGEGE